MKEVCHIKFSLSNLYPGIVEATGEQNSFASFKCFCNKLYYLSNFKDFNN